MRFNQFCFRCLIYLCFVAFGYGQQETVEAYVYEETATQDSIESEVDEYSETIEYPIFVPPTYNSKTEIFTVTNVPSPRGANINGYVSDPNDYISHSDEQRINELLFELEKKSSVEVAIVMLPSIGNEVPKDFAVALFNSWGIGKADTDNGLLILSVMDQRRTEFEAGYGLGPILTDVVCFRIGTNEIVPNFKEGDYGNGILNAVQRVKQFLEEPSAIDEIYSNEVVYSDGDAVPNSGFSFWHFLLIYGLICAVLGLFQYNTLWNIENSKDDFYDKYNHLEKVNYGCFVMFLFPIPFVFLNKLIKKRLKAYRYAPRYSKMNGKLLEIKSEWAENVFLEKAQILEEKLNSIRYDVWVTDDESDIMILEYEGKNSRKYDDCKECGYKTFGKTRSTVTVSPTYDSEGERVDDYECRNCNYQESKVVEVARRVRSSSSSSSSSSYSSSSSSSSSFGGGSSGGGGAGVSW